MLTVIGILWVIILSSLAPADAWVHGVRLNTLSFGSVFKYNSNYPTHYLDADTYYNTWADDGNIYLNSDDSDGWNGAAPTSNTALSTFSGYTTSDTGTLVNNMAAWGTATQTGSDSATFKSTGLISVSGTLYKMVGRDIYGAWSGTSGNQQTVLSGQLLKSSNHGVTFTPAPPSTAQPYASPMFTGGPGLNTFTTGSFIQYGQDYQGNTVDNAGTYVYAISNDGYWNNGNVYYLGRVLISAIGNQSASDWSFYQGGDGMQGTNWGALATAVPIISSPLRLGIPSIQYANGRYFLFAWYYPSIAAGTTFDSTTTVWTIYEAPHPWGPWIVAQSTTWNPSGLNNPVVVSKSVSGCGFTLFAGGDFLNSNAQTGEYTLHIVPVTLGNCP